MQRSIRRATGGMVMAAGLVALRPGSRANRLVRHGLSSTGRTLRYAGGRLQGVTYHLAGRRPDPGVDDDVLADRVRSELGGLEKQLDLPRIHVMVERHVALLHGDVATRADADAIEEAVGAVSGIRGVESHLHIGLSKGDTRPSQGHAGTPS